MKVDGIDGSRLIKGKIDEISRQIIEKGGL